MTCAFCDAGDVERVGQWGGQIITAQWRCRACGSYFEAVREDFDDVREAPASSPAPPQAALRRASSEAK